MQASVHGANVHRCSNRGHHNIAQQIWRVRDLAVQLAGVLQLVERIVSGYFTSLLSGLSISGAHFLIFFGQDTCSAPHGMPMVKKAIKIVLRDGATGGSSSTSASRKRKRSAAATSSDGGNAAAHVPALFRSVPQPAVAVAAADADADNGPFNLDLDMDDMPCDTLLAVRSLISKGVAALCPLSAAGGSLPFVLKPMLHHALLSSVSATSNGGASNNNDNDAKIEETNRILTVGAATGVAVELDELRRTNAVRLLQLHGTGDAARDVAVVDTQTFEWGV